MLTRRSLLAGLGALVAAPAVVRTPGLLMPVRTIVATPWVFDPVTMAVSCLVRPGGTRMQRRWNNGRETGILLSDQAIDSFEAERRVRAFLADPNGYEDARLNTSGIAIALPPRFGSLRPAAALI